MTEGEPEEQRHPSTHPRSWSWKIAKLASKDHIVFGSQP